MIRIKAVNLFNSKQTLNKFASISLPIKISYQLMRAMKVINEEYNTFNQARNKLIQLYGARDDSGNLIFNESHNVVIKEDDIQKCASEMDQLLSTTIQIDIEPIVLPFIDDVNFTPMQLSYIDGIILFQ